VLQDSREVPKGDPADPLDTADVIEKYLEATGVSGEMIDQLTDLADLDNVAPLIRRLGA
jgi:hypothetical protein